jgi:hypothetical protein
MRRLATVFAVLCFALAVCAVAGGIRSRGGAADAGITRVVTTSGDSGPGSLRQALADAHAGETIHFDPAVFPPQAPVTITLLAPLDDIHTDYLTIDGSDSWVVLDGHMIAGSLIAGLRILGHGVTVRGLEIVRFSGFGVEVQGAGAVIGGDRSSGSGPFGQGNLLSGNGHSGLGLMGSGCYSATVRGNWMGSDPSGMSAWPNATDGVHINGGHDNWVEGNVMSGNSGSGVQACCTTGTQGNVLRDNLIGVAADGHTPLRNAICGITLHDGASGNTIGPGNIVAFNGAAGVEVATAASQGNTITANAIYSNTAAGILLSTGGNGELFPPAIESFDLSSGVVSGTACAGCRVEVFSDAGEQGARYEGAALADSAGEFALDLGALLHGPLLTATATDTQGNTSAFSPAASHEWVLQEGNRSARSWVQARRARELADNRIGQIFSGLYGLQDFPGLLDGPISSSGLKRMRISVNEGDSNYIVWSWPEMPISPEHDAFIRAIAAEGVRVIYRMVFWDKAYHNAGGTVGYPRFQTEAEIRRYLDFVRYIVRQLKDCVQYYEIWNEPACEDQLMCIPLETYLSVARRAIAVIHEEYPEARIVFPSVAGMNAPWIRQYFFDCLRSDIISQTDVLTWHPLFSSSPEFDSAYYYEYPSLVQDIKRVAEENGFRGEYMAEEFVYAMEGCSGCQPNDVLYSRARSGKYYARAIVSHLGWDVSAGVAGNFPDAVRNLATLMAGVRPEPVPFAMQTAARQVVTATFALAGGGYYVSCWTDGVALEDDAGTPLTLTLPGKAGYLAVAIDPLHGWQQSLLTTDAGPDLVIPNLRLRDYPILVLVAAPQRVYLPVARKVALSP